MNGPNQKILGAFVIGLALVGGTYTATHFGVPRKNMAAYSGGAVPERAAIAVTDNDNNGVEDWRDAFIGNAEIELPQPNASYTPPTTLTGKMGIQFFEDYVRAKNYGPFGRTSDEVVKDTVRELSVETEQKLFGLRDVEVMETWNDNDIRNYGNAMADVLLNNNSKEGLDNELIILKDILSNEKPERVKELLVIAASYKNMRDDSLLIPVPQPFLKEHLDLINTYEAIYQDIIGMSVGLTDPAVTLLRIKRYEDDALGLLLALQNLYLAIEPHASLFGVDDSAIIFGIFSARNATQQ